MSEGTGDWAAKLFGQFEPSSDARRMANANFEIFTAHVKAGFTPEQAMQVVCTMVTTALASDTFKHKDDNE